MSREQARAALANVEAPAWLAGVPGAVLQDGAALLVARCTQPCHARRCSTLPPSDAANA